MELGKSCNDAMLFENLPPVEWGTTKGKAEKPKTEAKQDGG